MEYMKWRSTIKTFTDFLYFRSPKHFFLLAQQAFWFDWRHFQMYILQDAKTVKKIEHKLIVSQALFKRTWKWTIMHDINDFFLDECSLIRDNEFNEY